MSQMQKMEVPPEGSLDLGEVPDEDLEAVDPYEYFLRNEPRLNKTPTTIDPETGWRMTTRDIGMTRNATADNKNEMVVFLDPVPHVRLDQNIPMRGWYKGKHEAKGVRARPCYTDALLTQPYGGFCHVGCGFAVYSGQYIATPDGPKSVDDLRSRDIVWGRSPLGIVPTPVTGVVNKKASFGLVIRVENGQEIRVTEDHPIWNPHRGWVQARTLRVGNWLEELNMKSPSDSGYTHITSIKNIPGSNVFDFETPTENYFLMGDPEKPPLLVHNCYINNGIRGYRGQGVSTVDMKYGEKIRKQLKGMRTGQAVYMSSFIDPFLELEEFYHNTEHCARAATDVGLPIFFLTRRKVPGWAYDLLKLNPHSYQQFSINTSNPDTWQRLSPRALPLDGMIEQVREMHRQGIYVSIQVNPIVPGVVDNWDICNLIHELAKAGADHLIFKFVEIVYPSANSMVAQMSKRFGNEKGEAFGALFTQNIGGVRTVAEEYRKAALDEYSVECRKAGVTMGLCYEYEYARDADGNIIDKAGVSIGARYLTADQCHGYRVPVYARNSAEEQFKPLDECPAEGCLTCGDLMGDYKVPCRSLWLGTAPAWTPQMLKIPVKGK